MDTRGGVSSGGGGRPACQSLLRAERPVPGRLTAAAPPVKAKRSLVRVTSAPSRAVKTAKNRTSPSEPELRLSDPKRSEEPVKPSRGWRRNRASSVPCFSNDAGLLDYWMKPAPAGKTVLTRKCR